MERRRVHTLHGNTFRGSPKRDLLFIFVSGVTHYDYEHPSGVGALSGWIILPSSLSLTHARAWLMFLTDLCNLCP